MGSIWSKMTSGQNQQTDLVIKRYRLMKKAHLFLIIKVDAAQSSQLAAGEDTPSSSQSPIIPKTSLSAPIIFEDIWGDNIGEPTFKETSSSIDTDPIKYKDAKLDSEWIEDEEL